VSLFKIAVKDFVQSWSLSVEAGAALLGYIDLKPYGGGKI
jgi:hypothetical protein